MNKVIIVQARMTSTRLPGKILKEVLGKPLLEYQVERLRRVRNADKIVIATTTNNTDEPVVSLGGRLAVPVYRGPENDVLARYHGAARAYGAGLVVRVTSDCPLIDPGVIDRVIGFYHEHKDAYDYVSNTLQRTYPTGMDTEVFPFTVLDEAYREALDAAEREHVTPFIYRRPERYRIGQVIAYNDTSRHRWTVDTPEDFELVRRIIEVIYPENPAFSLYDVLNLIDRNPSWTEINAHIVQKTLGERPDKESMHE